MVKNVPANAGAVGDWDLIPGLGRFPRGGNGNPCQYSCLRNPMDGGAWWAAVHGVAEGHILNVQFLLILFFVVFIIEINRDMISSKSEYNESNCF